MSLAAMRAQDGKGVALALEKRQAPNAGMCYHGPRPVKGGNMRDIAWRMALTLMALLALVTLAPNLSFSTAPYQLEEALGQPPQAVVSHYLTAVAQGDVEAALALWQEPVAPDGSPNGVRASVTEGLARYGTGMQHGVVDVTWWRTCCEAAAIDDPDTAGVAAVRVAITGDDQGTQIYVFEVRAGDGQGGEPSGPSLRDWVITGAHREHQVSQVQAWR
jgi:hypothetical protein